MELIFLDKDFKPVTIMDVYDSLIWTDRYNSYGDFELYTAADSDVLTKFQEANYIYSNLSEHIMVIEGLQINADSEAGTFVTLTGRSLESILDRRIIWTKTKLTGNLQLGIKKLITENIINPTIAARKIDNFIFDMSTDPAVTSLTLETQIFGDNLYDDIQLICDTFDLGFKILLYEDNSMHFSLYSGKDRTYSQTTNPFVIFSPNYENLINSNYAETTKTLKTHVLVVGEDGKKISVDVSDLYIGINRRELFSDASDISKTMDDETLTEEEYEDHLRQRGAENLSQNIITSSFDGQAETSVLFKYGEDFNMGDILQFRNEYNMEARSRVVEMVYSESKDGVGMYPTFKAVADILED